jgi:hypothetical protein
MPMENDEVSQVAAKTGPAARRWRRYIIQTRLKILAVRNKVKIMCLGQSDNLSEGGMGFYCPQPLEMNERVDIELELPGIKFPVKLSGIVRSYVNEVYGVEFGEMGTRQREEIMRACAALAKLQGGSIF